MLPEATLEVFPNGLKLVLVPDDHVEGVCFGLIVSSGSRHEPAHLAGISHFVEHMLFKGTAKRSALEITTAIEGRGGNFNAYTSEETTCFYSHVPFDCLAAAVDVICDMYRNASIPEGDFKLERGVVLEEIKMYSDEPDSVASENLSKALYPKNALGLPVAGCEETLLAMEPQTLRDYIAKCYVPSATCAVLAGRFEPAAARALVEAALGDMERGEPPKIKKVGRRPAPIPEIREKRDVKQVQLAVGFRSCGVRAPERKKFAAMAFDCMMGRTMSSRLFQSIREKRGLSYDIRSQLQFFEDVGGWAVTAGLDAARRDEAFDAICREFAKIKAKKPSAAELRRTKDYLIGNFRLGLENQRARMFYFGNMASTYGRVRSPERAIEATEAVTAEDVREAANEILDDSLRSVSWVEPLGADGK